MTKINIDEALWAYIDYVIDFFPIKKILIERVLPLKNMDRKAEIFVPQNYFNDNFKSALPNSFTSYDFEKLLEEYINEKKENIIVLNYFEDGKYHKSQGKWSKQKHRYFYFDTSVFFYIKAKIDQYDYSEMINLYKSDPCCSLVTTYNLESLHASEINENALLDIVKSTTALILDIYDGDSFLHIDLTNNK